MKFSHPNTHSVCVLFMMHKVHVGYKSCWFLRVVLSFCAGVSHVGGDMFDSIPNGDAIFMKVN